MIIADEDDKSKDSISSEDGNSKKAKSEGTSRNSKHRLLHLRTKGEIEASNATVDVYIVGIPTRSINTVIEYETSKYIYLVEHVLTGPSLLRNIVPAKDLQSLHHLRRIVKPEFLPLHLHQQNASPESEVSGDGCSALSTLYLLVGPTAATDHHQLLELLTKNEDLFAGLNWQLCTIPVPARAPTSTAQAAHWSEKYWPTVFRNTNPHGPHPSIVRRAELELLDNGGPERWMELAQQVAREITRAGMGIAVGAVVLDRNSKERKAAVAAVAGDSRWDRNIPSSNSSDTCSSGNVMGHAVLRAIGMVARKRAIIAESKLEGWRPTGVDDERTPFLDSPVTPTEERYFRLDSLDANGYLCLDLEIFVTHEPCVMCSMAILHSRFGRVVFGRRMPMTGAMTAEGDCMKGKKSLGYGLFWRPMELNWRLLCWEFSGNGIGRDLIDFEDMHA